VVSTTIGAEGLPVTHGANILLADTAEELANRVLDLLRDAPSRQRIGADGRKLVSSRFSWERAADRFSEICLEVVGQRRAAS
jgi:glycosyltransferase involved in cell wall biosynthesis